MIIKLATTCFIIGTMLAPVAAYSEDSDADRSHAAAYVEDSVITSKIKTKLAIDHPGSMKHISVETDSAGVVWLTGTANNQAEIDAAIATARNTENVKSVWSDLRIETDR
jgi:hyperosmotically inducible periplasmic protein